jgi:aspartate/methionine/tyrosine aminotransferase
MLTNYPNMPTGAPARRDLFEKLVDFAHRHGILLINDNPYGFILNKPQSILSVPGARECCMELNSLSKSHNMAGWRVGMLVGEASVIKEVLKVKSQMDSGMFRGIQEAAVAALNAGAEWYDALNAEYRRRREIACRIMDTIGCTYDPAAGGLYVWGRVPSGISAQNPDGAAAAMSDKFLYEAGVFLTPGFIFGSNGANYLRISLCANVPTLEKALEKIAFSLSAK